MYKDNKIGSVNDSHYKTAVMLDFQIVHLCDNNGIWLFPGDDVPDNITVTVVIISSGVVVNLPEAKRMVIVDDI